MQHLNTSTYQYLPVRYRIVLCRIPTSLRVLVCQCGSALILLHRGRILLFDYYLSLQLPQLIHKSHHHFLDFI